MDALELCHYSVKGMKWKAHRNRKKRADNIAPKRRSMPRQTAKYDPLDKYRQSSGSAPNVDWKVNEDGSVTFKYYITSQGDPNNRMDLFSEMVYVPDVDPNSKEFAEMVQRGVTGAETAIRNWQRDNADMVIDKDGNIIKRK